MSLTESEFVFLSGEELDVFALRKRDVERHVAMSLICYFCVRHVIGSEFLRK